MMSCLAALVGGAPNAVPFVGSLVVTAQVSNMATDLRTVSEIAFTHTSWGSAGGSFLQLGAAVNDTSLSATNLNLNDITAFSLTGATLSTTGRDFGQFTVTSFTTSVSTMNSVTYLVFGNYSENFSTDVLTPNTPTAEITISLTILSNPAFCGGAACVVSASATMASPPAVRIPEPATIALLGAGPFGIAAARGYHWSF